jgi:polysaccharide biosynthesis protein PslJ
MASEVLARPRAVAAPDATALRELPSWPIVVLFAGYGVWWMLGLGAFAVPIVGLAMVVLLAVRGHLVVPVGFVLWALFLAFVAAAAVEIDSGVRYIGYGVRVSNYVGAGIVLLYVVNCSRSRTPDRLIVMAMVGYLAVVVVGGWLGIVMPTGRLSTPTELLLPSSISNNDYVRALVHPSFAEVQRPYGSPVLFTRPSAPFAYTNGWGCNMALLVPFAAAALAIGRRWARVLTIVLLLAAAAPAFATLNRGMFLAIIIAVAYAAVRYALRGRFLPFLVLAAGLGTVVLAAVTTGVAGEIALRLRYSETNVGRMTIYREAFRGTLDSPLLGNGSPRPSETLNISIGTQGQLWNIMFSYGFVAIAAYLGWFAYAVWVSRRARTPLLLWMHVVLVLALLTTVYYGYDGPQLAIAMVAAAVVMRPRDRPLLA